MVEQYIEFIGRHPVLAMIWVALFFMLISSIIKDKFSKVRHIGTSELSLLVNRQHGVVVDMRSQADFRKGTIAEAVHFEPEKAREKDFSALEKYKSNPIIMVCTSGVTAGSAADAMSKAGFEQVYVLSGGIGAWQNANLPMTAKGK